MATTDSNGNVAAPLPPPPPFSTSKPPNFIPISDITSHDDQDDPQKSPPLPTTHDVEAKRTVSPEKAPLEPVRSPVDEETLGDEVPLAAQLPLSTFTLPTFPPSASHLRSLTLTSDIPLPDYQSILTSPTNQQSSSSSPPQLPQSITHLTLELFSLGFPGTPPFLTNLAAALPNLKSVTTFATLLDGLDAASRKDAVKVWEVARGVREVHFIDSFVRTGYWTDVGKVWETMAREEREVAAAANGGGGNGAGVGGVGGLQVVEISYTYRGHTDSDFLARIHGEELPLLIVPGLVGVGFGFVEEQEGDEALDMDSKEGKKDGKDELAGGILPFASDSRATKALLRRFEGMKKGELGELRVLNVNMWTLTVEDVKELLAAITSAGGEVATGLIDLTMSVLMTNSWFSELAEVLKVSPATRRLEGLEIVGVPSLRKAEGTASGPGRVDQQIDNIMDTGDEGWGSESGGKVKLLSKAEVQDAFGKGDCEKLARFEMSVLKVRKVGAAKFERKEGGGSWSG